jgi:hypothetical protein
MIPQFVVLEAPPEVAYLEEMFDGYQLPRSFLDQVLRDTVKLLQDARSAPETLKAYVERFRREHYWPMTEITYRPIQVLGENLQKQFFDWKMYLPDGTLPFNYHDRDRIDYEYVVLNCDMGQVYRGSNGQRWI